MSGSSARLEWRYAAAGLGWGVAVGGATGGLLALAAVVSLVVEADGPGGVVEWAGVFLAVPLYGLLLGAVLGGVAGMPGGLVNAVVQPRVRGDRAAWWSSWSVSTLTAVLVVGAVGAWQTPRGAVHVDAAGMGPEDVGAAAVMLVPALLGGWLMARTGRGLRDRRAQHASAGPGAVAVRSSERRK